MQAAIAESIAESAESDKPREMKQDEYVVYPYMLHIAYTRTCTCPCIERPIEYLFYSWLISFLELTWRVLLTY